MNARREVRVECYAGWRGDERPVAFWVDDRRVGVETILETWSTENGTYFRIAGEDRAQHVLRRDDRRDRWELVESVLSSREDDNK